MSNQRMLSILLLSCFLFLFLSPGFGVEVMGTVEQYVTSLTDPHQKKMSEGKWRKMMVQTNDDYQDAGPNFPGAYHDPKKTSKGKTRKMMVQTNDDYQDAGPNFPGAYHDPKKTSEGKTRKMIVQTNDNYHDEGPNFPGAYRNLKI